ncbi:hypothetical protein Clacol_003520 [Clathrus columnatus]|uniref:UDP-N-acetylglucosamine diphosphorylase n=1 Tax=Clathrus columnatus TaxID=1419009 RepID=A0AAV5A9G6_9AGAM|nr:hypothetical protein Clacol_003520 [Clathrus columnatus]
MTVSPAIDPTSLFEEYKAANQGHVFTYWQTLSPSERNSLLSQLSSIDVERVNTIYKRAIESEKNAGAQADIEPLPKDKVESIVVRKDPSVGSKTQEWRSTGLKAIASNRVAVLLMAGGQGTRLGSSAPKGCYDIGLPSHKSLFQYQAERIKRLQTVAAQAEGKKPDQVVVPWYVMTSGPTRPETQDFFEKNAYFGLDKANVVFFEQGTLPCLTLDGKIMLETVSRVAVAPDGNGGLYAALRQPLSPSDPKRTVLTDLRSRKIEYIHAYCVDNCLVKVADPVFIGYNIHTGAECAAKVVPKSTPTESVGVIALKNGKYSVVEYSEISKEQAERRDSQTGDLTFRAANIANHFYTTSFLERVESFEDEMPFHIARKKIPYVPTPNISPNFSISTSPESSASSTPPQTVKPSTPNGLKLELFVFDVFPFARKFSVLEVSRSDEFSPLKNAPGTGADDPETSRRDLLKVQRGWLEDAGASFQGNPDIEVSPLVSYSGEGLERSKGVVLKRNGILDSLDALKTLA